MTGIPAEVFDHLNDMPSVQAVEQRSIENPSTSLSAADDWLFDALGAFRTASGVNVNPATALTYAAFWRGVNLISNDVGKLPLFLYRREGGGKERDLRHSAYYLLRHKPCPELTAIVFRKTLQGHALIQGNGYAFIQRDAFARPLELWPLDPMETYPVRADGVLWYVHQLPTGEMRRLAYTDVLHIRGLSFDGLLGYNVIAKARESLGLGMALQTYGSVFFRNSARPHVVLETPNRLDPKARRELADSWERMHAGLENAHRTAVLDSGLKASALQINAKDAQLLEMRQFEIREVANWLSLPPHKLGDPSRTAYASLEQENQAYLDEALDPWLVTWEEECRDKLLTEFQKERDTHVIQFKRRELVRANLAERGAYYVQAVTNGWMSPDEVREEEDMNATPEGRGKVYFRPLNMERIEVGLPDPDDENEMQPAVTQAPPDGTALLDLPDVRQTDNYSCILPGQELQGQVIGGSKAWYSGEVIEIRTGSGKSLAVTPNHPVMTPEGFVSAGKLEKSHSLLRYVGKNEADFGRNDEQYAPAPVEKVFDTLYAVTAPILHSDAMASPLDFHGDAERFQGKIQVVGSYCQLRSNIVPQRPKNLNERELVGAGFYKQPLASGGSLQLRSGGSGAASNCSVGVGGSLSDGGLAQADPIQASGGRLRSQRDSVSLESVSDCATIQPMASRKPFDGRAGQVFGFEGADVFNDVASGLPLYQPTTFGRTPDCNASLAECFGQGRAVDAVLAAKLLQRGAGAVVADQIVEIRKCHYEGPVYDFESPHGHILVNDLYISNCGAAAAMSVGKYFGVGPDTLEEWKAALGTTPQDSTRPIRIIQYLAQLGLKVTAASNLTIEDLVRFWKAGQPVLTPIQEYGVPGKQASFDYGHYVAVIGAALGQIFVQDPSIDNVLEDEDADQTPGRMLIDEATWMKIWHDQDADGMPYVQYGIAVGKDLLPEAAETDETAETPPNDPPGAGKPPNGSGGPQKPSEPPPKAPEPAPKRSDGVEVTSSLHPLYTPLPGNHSELVEAHRQILTDVLRRMAKRIGTHARRAAKDPAKFAEFLEGLDAEHGSIIREAITPAVKAASILAEREHDPALISIGMLHGAWMQLNSLRHGKPAAELPAAVDEWLTGFEDGTPTQLAATILGEVPAEPTIELKSEPSPEPELPPDTAPEVPEPPTADSAPAPEPPVPSPDLNPPSGE